MSDQSAPTAAELGERLSNTGRWGADDQVGTLNYVTTVTTAAAAALVTSGRVVAVGHAFDLGATVHKPRPGFHRMLWRENSSAATDMVVLEPHGFEVTHIDAIAHVSWDGLVYNDRPWSEVLTRDGLAFADVAPLGRGVATRGVLLDVPASRGRAWVDREEEISPADLERAENWAGVRVGTGDVLVVRTGLQARELETGPQSPQVRAGLGVDCLAWLHQREVAVFGGDCMERFPSTHPELDAPLHQIGLARMGLVLIDNIAVEELAAACAEEARWEFMFTAAPLRLPGATGSPVNPLCIF